jgi:NAD(P)-dependent dehydrogenase (short-subunit alcohol dehydrogenase family)
MKQKLAIIGGSSGIGLAAARQAAAEFDVVISARSPAKLTAALQQIGHGASGQVLDYADSASIQQFFAATGAVDHLILCAAEPAAWGAFNTLKPETLSAAFNSKFWGYFHSLQAALPSLRRDGSVSFVTGAAGRASIPATAGLAAVNGAIERMAMTLAKELAPLRVNVVSPGLVDTPAYDAMPSPQKQAMFAATAARLPVGHAGTASDIAAVLVMLLHNTYISGAVLDVDGGARLG